MAFGGYLIKNTKGATIDRYIQFDTYNTTPNIREEIVAYRDDNSRNLTRVTADGHKSTIQFTTMELNLARKTAIQSFFKASELIEKERKVRLTYWNDEDNMYKTTDFYIPDIKYTIKRITANDIIYEPIEINLIEY